MQRKVAVQCQAAQTAQTDVIQNFLNPLPHMPILGPSDSATNKDMISKPWTNEDTII